TSIAHRVPCARPTHTHTHTPRSVVHTHTHTHTVLALVFTHTHTHTVLALVFTHTRTHTHTHELWRVKVCFSLSDGCYLIVTKDTRAGEAAGAEQLLWCISAAG